MPFQYALEELLPTKGVLPENANRWNSNRTYHIVHQDMAETDPNGVFRLVNNSGKPVSIWVPLHDRKAQITEKAVQSARSSAAPHEDILGEELVVGDFVSFSQTETADLYIGKVISFTPKKVRVLSYHTNELVSKNPSGLIKIQQELL